MRLLSLVLFVAMVGSSGCAVGSQPMRHGDAGRDGGAALDGNASDAGLDAGAVDGGALDTGSDAAANDSATSPDAAMYDAGSVIACTAANASAVCGTRPCVDGYCCDQPCSGTCRNCAVAGAEGHCSMQAAGDDLDDECATQAPSTCGTTGVCDGAGACAFHPSTVACDDAMACTTGDLCTGAGVCHGAAPSGCTPAAGNECCLGSCASAGCQTTAGACADICGAVQLTVMRACMGCGAARAAGSCLGGAIHACDATSHLLCQQIACGGATYQCTQVGGVWSWRTMTACDDANACTYGDACSAGTCSGTALTCTSTACMTSACNGTSSCTQTPRTGVMCDDGNACTYSDACSAAGACVGGASVTCTDTACLARTCNGTATCAQTIRSGMSCDDSAACTYGETCNAAGVCGTGTSVTCPADTTCRTYACNGTSTCAGTARNVGGTCDDGNATTMFDVCRADGTCSGSTCSPTLVTVFSDDFATPSSATWANGTDVAVGTSRWLATTSARHGVRINGGFLDITNVRSSSPDHGQGYAYVRTGGTSSAYDNARYQPVLRSNTGQSVVWSLNMHRDDPESTDGGFSCSSSSSQNDITVGVAYVLGADTASGLQANAGTCSASASSVGYAVVMGGSSRHVRLVRFVNGLRNGTLTDIVASGAFPANAFLSVRVTYNATNDQWKLEVRNDGSSSFASPAAGTFSFTGMATDATYATTSLGFSGPYFQTGCTGFCSSTYTARFDNVTVGMRCAP